MTFPSGSGWPCGERRTAGQLQNSTSRRSATSRFPPPLRALPELGIASGRRTYARYDLTRELAADASADNMMLAIVTSGTGMMSQRGRDVTVHAGDATLLSATEPNSSTLHGNGSFIVVAIPSARLSPAVINLGSMLGRLVPAGNEALGLLRSYLGILKESDKLSTAELRRVVVLHVHDLVATALGATQDAAILAEERGIRSARLRAIMLDVVENLDRPQLGVGAVAKRHGVTPRYVQRLFEREGTTFRAYVLEQRLAAACRMLVDQRRDIGQISEIAYKVGFSDLSYFARTFRRKYGASPSDVRAAARSKI
jgi:AraC-like DNA-binding protein